jgi:hypothetical protein
MVVHGGSDKVNSARVTVLIVASILAFSLLFNGAQIALAQRGPGGPGGSQPGGPAGSDVYYTVKSILSTLNIALLSILLVVYAFTYNQARSEFLVGLIIFDIAMLLYAITSNPLIYGRFGFRGSGLGPFAMLPDLFSLAAVSVLLLQAFRYR